MEITVTINTPDLSEAINNLATAIAKPKSIQVISSEAESQPIPQETKTEEKAPEVKQASATQTKEAKAPVPIKEPEPEPTPTKPIDLNILCESGARLVEQGKMEQVINLLGKYGVQAINQLAESNYDAFAADLRSIGAQI